MMESETTLEPRKPHTTDADCDGKLHLGVCTVCGVTRGEPCGECGALSYHVAGCSEVG